MRRIVPILAAALALAGCAHATIRRAESLEDRPPRTIAVLQTDPGGAPPEVADFVRGIVAAEIQRRGYQVPPLSNVDAAVGDLPDSATPAELAQAAGTQAVLLSGVTRYSLETAFLNTRTAVGISLALYDRTGHELWIAEWTEVEDSAGQGPAIGIGVPLGPGAGIFLDASPIIDAANAEEAAHRPPFASVATRGVIRALDELPDGPLAR